MHIFAVQSNIGVCYLFINSNEMLIENEIRRLPDETMSLRVRQRRIIKMLDTVVQNYRQWRNFRDTVDNLNRLSNRECEVSISRADVTQAARRAVGM